MLNFDHWKEYDNRAKLLKSWWTDLSVEVLFWYCRQGGGEPLQLKAVAFFMPVNIVVYYFRHRSWLRPQQVYGLWANKRRQIECDSMERGEKSEQRAGCQVAVWWKNRLYHGLPISASEGEHDWTLSWEGADYFHKYEQNTMWPETNGPLLNQRKQEPSLNSDS